MILYLPMLLYRKHPLLVQKDQLRLVQAQYPRPKMIRLNFFYNTIIEFYWIIGVNVVEMTDL